MAAYGAAPHHEKSCARRPHLSGRNFIRKSPAVAAGLAMLRYLDAHPEVYEISKPAARS